MGHNSSGNEPLSSSPDPTAQPPSKPPPKRINFDDSVSSLAHWLPSLESEDKDGHFSRTIRVPDSGNRAPKSDGFELAEPLLEQDPSFDDDGDSNSPAAPSSPSSGPLESPGQQHVQNLLVFLSDMGDRDAPAAPRREDYWAEAARLRRLAWPLVLENVAGFSQSVFAVIFTGRLSSQSLAALVLATSFYNVTGLSIILGLASTLETLCGNSYGAGNHKAMGVLLQRSVAVCLTTASLVALAWSQAAPLLTWSGQDPQLAASAGLFLRTVIPALAITCFSESLRYFLVAQGAVRAAMAACFVTAAASLPLFYLFITVLGMGLRGAAYAVVSCSAVNLTCLLIYTLGRGRPKVWTRCWPGLQPRAACRGWRPYLRLAIPSTAMACAEWWCYELLIVLCGLTHPNPAHAVAVMGITFQISCIAYMAQLGLSGAVSIRVSNELGLGHPNAARVAAHVGAASSLLVASAAATGVLALRHVLPWVYTGDAGIAEGASRTLVPVAFCVLFDGTASALNGVARGAGRQRLGALVAVLAWWGLGLPLAYTFSFRLGYGVPGIWYGVLVSTSLQAAVMGYVVLFGLDYKHEADRAARRSGDVLHQCRAVCSEEQGGRGGQPGDELYRGGHVTVTLSSGPGQNDASHPYPYLQGRDWPPCHILSPGTTLPITMPAPGGIGGAGVGLSGAMAGSVTIAGASPRPAFAISVERVGSLGRSAFGRFQPQGVPRPRLVFPPAEDASRAAVRIHEEEGVADWHWVI